jgi:hypothetical protein
MSRWWMGTALIAMWLAETASAQAPYLPLASGGAPVPEPMPCPTAPAGMAPAPSQCMSVVELPSNLPNAWCQEPVYCPPAFYVYVGGMGLQRQRMGHVPIAVLDPGQGNTGNAPPRTAPVVSDLNDIDPNFNWGVRATVGYHWENQALELSGFYLFQNDSFKVTAIPGRLDSFFSRPPLGFEGDNGLWLQADQIRNSLKTTLANAEANYLWWLDSISNVHWILGTRYVDVRERLSVLTDDDGLTVRDINGQPDLTKIATYTTRTHNRILAAQLGFEWDLPITWWLAFSMTVKGGWGANFLETDLLLERGDGLIGRRGERNNIFFSHLYDLGFFLDWNLLPQLHVRTGYNLLWLEHVAEASGQLNFDLSRPVGTRKQDGSIFYQGPSFELQFVF